MPQYIVTLSNEEIQELSGLIRKGGKGRDKKDNPGHGQPEYTYDSLKMLWQ